MMVASTDVASSPAQAPTLTGAGNGTIQVIAPTGALTSSAPFRVLP